MNLATWRVACWQAFALYDWSGARRREGKGLRLAWNRHLSLPPVQSSERGIACYVGGGPVLSLVTGSAALGLAGAWGVRPRQLLA